LLIVSKSILLSEEKNGLNFYTLITVGLCRLHL